MKPYRKRAKGSWQQGKGCKGDGPERQFSKREIEQQLDEDEESYLDRYHKGARTKNMKARLEYRIRWYEQYVKGWEDRGTSSSMMNYFHSSLTEAKKDLQEFLDKEKA